ncbi:MAG: tRNA dihydrouridine synthase DusB [Chthoniobacterales bacterium]|nr:tRNA dihydrouridine synthase DusB [Chthoniobacterales bacterium]
METSTPQTSFARRPEQPVLFLAPMAGVTNSVFRRICKARGADVLTTEFVSADGVLHRNERTARYVGFLPDERPLGVQLFGADAEHLARGASAVVEWVQPDFIDINFGCPVNKVVCKNGGSALLRNGELLASIASAVVQAVAPLPVTAKIRTGWDAQSVNAADNARRLEDAGIKRLTIHGRTRAQGYSGEADWDVIASAADAVLIPVVGNGDINSATTALHRWRNTPVSGLMIGRAAMSSPWIFHEIKAAFRGEDAPPSPTLSDRWNLVEQHCREELQHWHHTAKGMHAMRARLMAYSRGLPSSRELRRRFGAIESLEQLAEIRAWHENAVHEPVDTEEPQHVAPSLAHL